MSGECWCDYHQGIPRGERGAGGWTCVEADEIEARERQGRMAVDTDFEQKAEIKAKLRRAAAYLQGGNTAYFSDRPKLDAIRLLYRLADEAHPNGGAD